MNRVADVISTINDTAYKYVTTFQERTLEANKSVVSFVQRRSPSFLTVPALPDFGAVEDIVKTNSDFAAKLVEADTKFALSLLDVWSGASSTPAQ